MRSTLPCLWVEPKISVIIPCYNYGRFLGETIGSLQEQTYKNWEAIIINDGSTDDTERIALALSQDDSRLIYVYQANAGTSEAKNTGIRMAQGELLLFLDADDLITPAKLMAHVEHFRVNPDIDISYSRFRYFEDGGAGKLFTKLDLSSDVEWSKVLEGRYEVAFPVFVKNNNMAIHAAIIKKSLVDKVGFFDPAMRALEDWDYWLRCILRGAYMSFLAEPAAMALTRVHQGSATHKVDFSNYLNIIYEKMLAETDRIRKGGDYKFYLLVKRELDSALRKRRKSLLRRERRDARRAICSVGFMNYKELSLIAKDLGFLVFVKVYLAAFWSLFFS